MYNIAQKCLKRFMVRKDATVIFMTQVNADAAMGAQARMAVVGTGNANGKGAAAANGKTLPLGLWGREAS